PYRPPPAAAPDGSAPGAHGDARGVSAGPRGADGSAEAGDGEVLAPVRIADAGVAGLLEPGDVVDVLAVGGKDGAPARTVVRAARVAEIPGTADPPDAESGAGSGVESRADEPGAAETEGTTGAAESAAGPDASAAPDVPVVPEGRSPWGAPEPTGWDDGTLVVLSVPRATAAALAGAAAERGLAVTFR
ncbi:hypothetical protein, partial [Streptomyces synnematoformans]|uniref:hypothetical protein n=1 Tax=Streptomyces synnematoformans TaxID=415721 RepID=UPI0031CFF9ED